MLQPRSAVQARGAGPTLQVALLLLLASCGGDPRPQARIATAAAVATLAPSTGGGVRAVAAAGTCTPTDAHGKHASVGLDCSRCHPCGGALGFANAFTYPKGNTSAGGTIVPSTATAPATCSVGCHSPLGSGPTTIAWNTPGPLACTGCHAVTSLVPQHPAVSASATRADCQTCHDVANHAAGTVVLLSHPAAWMTRSDLGFHAYAADRGLAACQTCHRQDLSGSPYAPACAQCHAAGGPAASLTTCTGCHGGTDNASGAPPRAIWGHGSDPVRVGAHSGHVAGSTLAPAYDCGICHVKPADLFAAGHIDAIGPAEVPTATVAFSSIAAGGVSPSWSRTSATCSNTYCHGTTLTGGTNTAPNWTMVGVGQAACGTCHGVPPPAPHPPVSGGTAGCFVCHNLTIDQLGNVIPPSAGGKHLDGTVQATGHAASWMDPASPSFHALSANRGISGCQPCHGADLSGGTTGVACVRCHAAGGSANDFATCTACHGGTDNPSGAPPRATWGNTDPLAVGAHTSHVAATHKMALPFDCVACHAKPTSVLSAGHVDGSVTVTGYTGTDPRLLAAVGAPGWSIVTGTCATSYCHGNFEGGNAFPGVAAPNLPVWAAVGAGQADCGTCHGLPPDTGRLISVGGPSFHAHTFHMAVGLGCGNCHPGYTYAGGPINVTTHVNGTVEIGRNIRQWNHATGVCVGCHGRSTWW
jgi:predicted CxxxxCH...CXXCH cytochrome family protein